MQFVLGDDRPSSVVGYSRWFTDDSAAASKLRQADEVFCAEVEEAGALCDVAARRRALEIASERHRQRYLAIVINFGVE